MYILLLCVGVRVNISCFGAKMQLLSLRISFQGKTTLNNALQIDLRRLNTRLDYEVERVPTPYGSRTDLWRCKLELPYPEKVSVYGEGINKKDAEKRCSAAACLKLLVSVTYP